MINQDRIIQKMEEALSQAKSAKDTQATKEHIRALSALCDLVLEESTTKPQESPSVNTSTIDELELRKMIGDHDPKSSADQEKAEHTYEQPNSLLDF
ncbi:hypothetical protein SAMN05421734_101125 [Pelagirhabdus alkalitolerans]|uniref:YwdI family protein n=1 Tax=Pelagirhabdus alkalitolerans TaxID=1612202 RepID=A0A1G6GKJ4_9BACI|nr:DUF5327 family protein [Pelagirhabdus alkalitolerans]SDB81696.1 hypothetical protein SAMN05421734_101125 [Pelagirhabdus alkalitolerans]